MRTDFYAVFEDEVGAAEVLRKVEDALGEKWADPVIHPFESTRLIPWNVAYLSEHEILIHGRERMRVDEATKRGFDIGFHKGKFAQAARKIEEARFTLELLPSALSVPNFPACRALFYGIQSSIYSAREAIKRSCGLVGDDGRKWWAQKEKELKCNEPLFQALHIDYNRDKHGEASGILIPTLKLRSYEGPAPDIISGEGVFIVENKGSIEAQRVFHRAIDASMELRLDLDLLNVANVGVATNSVEATLKRQISYFETLIKDAREKFGA